MMQDDHKTEKLDEADGLLKQGKYSEAIALLENICGIYPEEESVLLRLAWASWDNGNKEGSIAYWEILLDRELQRKVFTGFAYDELVRIYKQEGEIEKLVAIHHRHHRHRLQPDPAGGADRCDIRPALGDTRAEVGS